MSNYKANSFLGRYYKFIFNGVLPETTCDLYRNILFSIIFFPLFIISAVPLWADENWENKSLFRKTFNGFLLWFGAFVAGLLGLAILYKAGFIFWNNFPLVPALLVGLITFVIVFGGVILTIVGLIWLGMVTYEKTSEYFNNKKWERRAAAVNAPQAEKKPSKVQVIIDTLKNKYCSKITWEYEDTQSGS